MLNISETLQHKDINIMELTSSYNKTCQNLAAKKFCSI